MYCYSSGKTIPINPFGDRKIKEHIIDKSGRKIYKTDLMMCEECKCYIQKRILKQHCRTLKHIKNLSNKKLF